MIAQRGVPITCQAGGGAVRAGFKAGQSTSIITIMGPDPTNAADHAVIRQLFDEYILMYATRDDRLTTLFSDNFSGFTGGGNFLVKDKTEWVAITRQDFAQVKDAIRIEPRDLKIQPLSGSVAIATTFFTIHLPIKDHILSLETARLVLIFRREEAGWKIAHSSISIPYHLVRDGEVYPLKELTDRNQELERLVAARTTQLQSSEERYRSILNASPDDITITDNAGRILMVSPAAFALFGHAKDFDFAGRHITDFLAPESRALALQHITQRLNGVLVGPAEYRGLRADGTMFEVEGNTEFIRNAQGEPAGMVVIIRDITNRKQAEAERKRLADENRHLQKTESLRLLAGAIAHHFNNHLHSVMLGIELAMHETSGHAGSHKELGLTLQAARKAAELSKLMLTYLGQTATTLELLDFAAICHQGLAALRPGLPPSVTLKTDLPSPGPTIHAGANQIEMVLANLVTNAAEARGDAGGVIRVSLKTVAAAKIAAAHRFPVGAQPTAPVYACLKVADTGCGIKEQDFDKIFDPFFTSKFLGRGMGLAVVLGIVRAHNGIITVESEPGRGSVFRVFLPVAPGREVEPKK